MAERDWATEAKNLSYRFATEGWPARMAKSAVQAFKLPGDYLAGKFNTQPSVHGQWSDYDEAIALLNAGEAENRASDLAGVVMGGAYASPSVSGAVGMGVRTAPVSNYTRPLSDFTQKVFRETSPEDALTVLPHSADTVGYGPVGAPRQYYADTPELALGQGTNKGVRVGYDASAFEGQINQAKPMWQPMFEGGSGEYIATPQRGANVREAVKSVEIDKSALNAAPRWVKARYNALVEKMKTSGWDATDSEQYINLVRKYGLAAGAAAPAVLSDNES